MRNSLIYSAILHIAILLVVLFGLPSFYSQNIHDEQVITVEILPISEFTNVKPPKIAPKVNVRPKREVTSATEPKKALPDPTIRPEPEITPEVKPKPKPIKEKEIIREKIIEPLAKPIKVEEKKETPKAEPEVVDEPELSFDSVLKTIEEMDTSPEEKAPEEDEIDFSAIEEMLSKPTKTPQYKPGLPLSISEKDAIRQQIMQHWSLSSASGGKDAQDMVVTLHIKMSPDGTVRDIKISNQLRYNTDSFFKAMADSAVRAVYKSSPLKGLPAEKYDTKDGWRELNINFDPRDMFF